MKTLSRKNRLANTYRVKAVSAIAIICYGIAPVFSAPVKLAIATVLSVVTLASTTQLAAAPIEVIEGQPDVVAEGDRRYTTAREAPENGEGSGAGGYTNSTSGRTNKNAQRESGVSSAAVRNQSAELFVKIQGLEAEIRELRGLLEQQTYLIDQLTQRRMDDYLDLDRRIGELQRGGASKSGLQPEPVAKKPEPRVVQTAKPVASNKPAVAPVARQADEAKTAYRAAYEKVKERKFGEAKTALITFVGDYPGSHYVPNAHFWLGELYYLDSQLERSRDAFYTLVSEHSTHRKVADAKFKLGKIYHQLGDAEQAKIMLQSVLSDHPGSKAANPAREYLKNSLR